MRADWIAVDWGTSNLRAWAMGADGSALAEASSGDGMAGLAREAFEGALLSLVGTWLGEDATTVIACGMVGSRQGWAEAPYRAVPCAPAGGAVRVETRDPRLAMHILPGLKQMDPPDVMRGEETQVAGFLACEPDFEGALCLPGTHSKWVEAAGGRVAAFRTVMTGEIFALLSKSSVLRHSVGATMGAGFEATVDEALAAPEAVPAHLFALRAGDLLSDVAPEDARARLSGLLIGAELAAMAGRWRGRPVALIGASGLAALYARALDVAGVSAHMADGTACTLDGLRAAHAEIAP